MSKSKRGEQSKASNVTKEIADLLSAKEKATREGKKALAKKLRRQLRKKDYYISVVTREKNKTKEKKGKKKSEKVA